MTARGWLAAGLVLSLAGGAFGQGAPPESPAKPEPRKQATPADEGEALQSSAFEAMSRREYAEAAELFRRQIAVDADNFVPHYNLACALAMAGSVDAAGESLIRACELGFIDHHYLTSDPQLASIRGSPAYRALVDHWPEILEKNRDANLAIVKGFFPGKYDVTLDEGKRLAFTSAFDPGSTSRARGELDKVCAWAIANLFPDLFEPDAMRLDPWVVVVLPDRRGFDLWALKTFGSGARGVVDQIGGSYSHDQKRLVCQDLGGTFRHEFMHVLHWRDNARHGQMHAVWVQEGLCSLVEDYDPAPGGGISPVPSWRTNQAMRLARARRMPTLAEFTSIPRERFTGSRPLQRYAQARAIFMWMLSEGKLREWYDAYVEGFREDPSGLAAIERVFGGPMPELDERVRAYVAGLPEVAEELKPGMAGMGFSIDSGAGDGPIARDFIPASPARAAGMRRGDAILAIDGRPTADLYELVRVLSSYAPGQTVTVSYRRGRLHGETSFALIRLGE